MLKFIICEDNKNYLDKVNILLNKIMMSYNFDYKIHKFLKYDNNLHKIIEDSNNQKIYILDVELPEISGLEIASEIRENDWNSIIIFLTAHNECRDDVFYSRLLALDYISKNQLSYDRLSETISLVLNKINEEKLYTFKHNSTTYRIKLSDIVYIEKIQSNRKCLIITDNNDEYEVNDTITNILNTLGKDFFRSHKSCIVNTTKIKTIDCTNNIITFKNGSQTDLLSIRKRKELKQYVRNR